MDQTHLAAFETQRPRLHAVAYRILGSLEDSADAVQETWLRLQRTEPTTIENLEAWLTTAVARVSLNLLRARRNNAAQPLDRFTPEPVVGPESGDDPAHEAVLADAVGIALQVVLDSLNPAERLAFVLHDMFAVSFSEIAEILDRSTDATRQLASRARRQIRDAAPAPDPDITRQRAAVDAYFAAARDGDLDALAAVLAPAVVLRAHQRSGAPLVLNGPERVSQGALIARDLVPRARPATVNGAAGAVAYRDGKPFAILAFTVIDDRILGIDVFNDPELVPRLVAPSL
jgi:RNA polymerase sigma-70 factor, ECF subfamily